MPHFDLCIIGSGSGNSIVDERFSDLRIAMVERGVGPNHVFGGTCLNVGCIPSKMFVLPADYATSPAEAARLGVDLRLDATHWQAIRDRVFGRIDSISSDGERYRATANNVTLYRDQGHFVDAKTLDVAGSRVTADRFVIAAGSRPNPLDIAGLNEVAYHTSDTIMRIADLPPSMIIIGGGFEAAEFGHVFAAFGVDVTIMIRSDRMIRMEDADISERFTKVFSDRVRLLTGVDFSHVENTDSGGVAVHRRNGDPVHTDMLLVATGRVSNSDQLNVAAAGIKTLGDGRIWTDDFQRSSDPDVFALGDVCSPYQLKHVANHEERVVQHNLLNPDDMIPSDHRVVPAAIFSHPQVATVGVTEADAVAADLDFVKVVQEYGSVAYGWALEDTQHFVKLLADRQTKQLLGAHVIGPQASTVIQPLIQAMSFGLTTDRMARGQYWIHPALPEVIENALLSLPYDGPR